MLAALREIGLAETLDELDAHLADPDELAEEHARVSLPIVSIARDLLRIPAVERAAVLRHDQPDPSGEAALLRLDQVPQHLQVAPFVLRWPERVNAARHASILTTDRVHGGDQQRNDVVRRERMRRWIHRMPPE